MGASQNNNYLKSRILKNVDMQKGYLPQVRNRKLKNQSNISSNRF